MMIRFALFFMLVGGLHAQPIKQLEFLKWMEGTWFHESEGTTVKMVTRWVDGGRFMERDFSIKLGVEPLKKMRQTIFWDPARKKVRSWGVYSDGAFEEGVWRMKDGTVEVQREITHADGTRGKAVNHLTPIDAKNCAWTSTKRKLGWKRLPNIPTTSLYKK